MATNGNADIAELSRARRPAEGKPQAIIRAMPRRRILTLVRAGSAALVLIAISYQIRVIVDAGSFQPTRFFAYFTIQSNLIGVVAFAWLLANGDRPRSHALEVFRGAAVAYLMVTFVVFWLLLSEADVGLGASWVDIVLHKVFPIVVVADWLIDPPQVRLTARDAVVWLAYPIAWTVVTLVRGAVDGWYPYPFIDPANGGYASVAITIVAITLGFLVLAGLLVWLSNVRRGAAEASPA